MGTAAFRQRKGGGASFCMHLVFFNSKSQLSVKLWLRPCRHPSLSSAPLNHSSCGRNQRTAESPFKLPSRIPSTASPFPPFPVLGNPSAAKQCKEKIDLNISPVFLCWVQCCIFLCFLKLWFLNGKSSQRRGPEKRPKAFFVCFVKREKKPSLFYPKEERASLLQFLKNVMRKARR